jgi:site-specific recombinase XerD
MPLSRPLIRILEPYLDSRDDDVPAACINDQGRPLTVSWIQRLVRDCGAQAGIADLPPNILRHTFATHAADRHGVVVTKALLSHSDLTRSEVYLHLSASRFRAVVRLHPYQSCHLLGVRDA